MDFCFGLIFLLFLYKIGYMYDKEQKKFINHISQKVRKQFVGYPDPAHDISHILRVVKWARKIALAEKAKSIFLCELSAWLHDIGRSIEKNPGENTNLHTELSYQLLKWWYSEDKSFDFLTRKEKIELLYAVRYHWNNEANKYDTAWILRDADKLDIFGKVGLKRTKQVFADDEKALNNFFRNLADIVGSIRTRTAQRIIKKNKLAEPLQKYYKSFLLSKVKEIKL